MQQRKTEISPTKDLLHPDLETGEATSSASANFASSTSSEEKDKDMISLAPLVQSMLQDPTHALRNVYKLSSFTSVPSMVFVWYLSAIFSITTSKTILMNMPYPYILCLCQCCVAYTISMYISTSMKTYRSLSGPSVILVVSIGVTYTLGFILTNMAFSKVSTSFAETVKASEPLTSVLFGYIFYSEFLSVKTYLTLIPICIGVATSCMSSDVFNWVGFSLAMGSNAFFSARAVLSKVLMRSHPDAMNEITLFTHISFVGILLVLPFACLFDFLPIINESIEENLKNEGSISSFTLSILYICNGIAYTTYNLMSFLVLVRTNIATHAVLNVFRRVFIIVFTAMYFRNHLSTLNMLGILLSIMGVLLFNRVKDSVRPLNTKQ